MSVAIIKTHKNEILKMDAERVMEWSKQLQFKMKEIDIINIVKLSLEIQLKYQKYE